MVSKRRTGSSFGSIAARTPLAAAGLRVGIMGGTFNPPHEGHALVARTVLKRLALDQLWWVVTPGNPLKSANPVPPLGQRMTAAAAFAGHPRMRVTGFEAGLGSAFTVDTLAFLRLRHRGVRFVWIMGADGLASFHRWRDWRKIAALMPFAVVDRPGYRLRAMASPAAKALGKSFLREDHAAALGRRDGAKWTFLTTRLSPASSTEIRAKTPRKKR